MKLEENDELDWFFPPDTVVDPAPWDRYWQDQISHGVLGFTDLMVMDGELVDAMRANGLARVLCAGSGLSLEPHALAWAGFDVTVLDLSPLATRLARDGTPAENRLKRLLDGRSGRGGGRLEFVCGDLCDLACCPGPYDVVIERRTLQLWPEADRAAAVQAVANRLAPRGIFFSQCHDSAWRPDEERRHALKAWFAAEGWPLWNSGDRLTGRVAWLMTTTG